MGKRRFEESIWKIIKGDKIYDNDSKCSKSRREWLFENNHK